MALNEALHELRRPLQAISLASGPEAGGALRSSVRMAATAMERLDREVNGGELPLPAEPIEMRALLEAAGRRWRARAKLGGGDLRVRWRAGRPIVEGRRPDLARALDNLIVNAIEHGGPRITVDAKLAPGGLRVVVADSGRAAAPGHEGAAERRRDAAGPLSRLGGRRRHGHGLAVVREVAQAHGGSFSLRLGERGSLAILDLPLGTGAREAA